MKDIQRINSISATDQSEKILINYILEGNLKDGDFLPTEMELCQKLGVGRSTLREALKTLESKGIIQKKRGIGVIVVDKGGEALRDILKLVLIRGRTTMDELFEVRYTNEIRTAELAAIHANEEDLMDMKKYLKIMSNNSSSIDDYIQADIDFHLAIAEASKNKVFYLILNTIRPLLEEMIQLINKEYDYRPEITYKFHQKIYNSIRSKNPEKAVLAMDEHLKETRAALSLFQIH